MNFPNSWMNLNVWTANSRVGDRIRARAPELGWRARSFSNMGIKKQAVLPEPEISIKITVKICGASLDFSLVFTSFGHSNNISSFQNQWDRFSLNGCGNFVAALCYAFYDGEAQSHRLETAFTLGRFCLLFDIIADIQSVRQIKTRQIHFSWLKINAQKTYKFLEFSHVFPSCSKIARTYSPF